MNFNAHTYLEGRHAFLGASKYHWINYDDEKLDITFKKHQATMMGTRLHDFACECILLKQKLPTTNKTLTMYVNDAIGYKMIPEQPLFYSENCFGTTDAISFKGDLLRIHDYKSGQTKASMNQLLIYASLFCLEYKAKPDDIKIELRIYQNDNVEIYIPDPEEIKYIMHKIVQFDLRIEKLKIGE